MMTKSGRPRLQRGSVSVDRLFQPKRQAYDIRFRCTLNGCDWTTRIWLRSPEDCFEAMYNRLRFGQGTGQGKLRYGKEFYRVVSCELSADQSRSEG